MNLLQRFAFNAARVASNSLGLSNKFHEAFFRYYGAHYMKYDVDAKTYLDKGFGTNPDVYAIISQKATKHSSIPFCVKKVKDKNAKNRLDLMELNMKNQTPQMMVKAMMLEKKAFEEEILEFPMDRPNPLQTWAQIIELYVTFLKTTGNFYLYMVRPEDGINSGKPIEIYVLPSHLMKIVLKEDADLRDMESPIKSYMLIEGQVYVEFMAEDVIHVKYANPFYDMQGSHLYGLSPLKAALRNIQSSNMAIDNNTKTMANGGAFGFIHGKGQTPLSMEQAQSIRTRLKEMDSDDSRMGKYAGVSSELGFTRISLTTDELKPFEFLKFDQKMICNVLNWELKLLNDDNTSSNLGGKSEYELAERRALTKSVMPDNRLLEEALNDRFLPLFKGYENTVFKFQYEDLPEMQPDMQMMGSWLNDALDRGVINRNMYLEAIKYPTSEDPDMDVHTVTTEVMSLSEALDPNFRIDEPKNV